MEHQRLFALLQLSDSAFPMGGFSHSLGLEAFTQHCGSSRNKMDPKVLLHAIICIIENSGSLSLPFVRAAHDTVSQCGLPEKPSSTATNKIHVEQELSETNAATSDSSRAWDERELSKESLPTITQSLILLDKICEVCTANHIAKRASTRQGSSMLEASLHTFPSLQSQGLSSVARELPHCHHAVLHGAIMACLGLGLDDALSSYMFGVTRTLVATAVRLDLVGAMEGQRLQWKLQEISADVIKRNWNRPVESASIKFPVVDILQNTQDTLFAKLFYS